MSRWFIQNMVGRHRHSHNIERLFHFEVSRQHSAIFLRWERISSALWGSRFSQVLCHLFSSLFCLFCLRFCNPLPLYFMGMAKISLVFYVLFVIFCSFPFMEKKISVVALPANSLYGII